MRVLVVGGAGAVGRTVTSGLLAKGHAVRVLDVVEATFSNKLDNQQPGSLLDGIVGSVADQEVVLAAAEGMDAVIHLSYAPRPPEEKAQWESNLQVNLNGTYNVFEACKAAGVKRVALASRAGVHSVRQCCNCAKKATRHEVNRLLVPTDALYIRLFTGNMFICRLPLLSSTARLCVCLLHGVRRDGAHPTAGCNGP